MSDPYFPYRMTFPHCGREIDIRVVEFPPKVIICPGCASVLKLEYTNEDSGASTYINCGTHKS